MRCGSFSLARAQAARRILTHASFTVSCSNYDRPGTPCEPGSYGGQAHLFETLEIIRASRPGRDQRSLLAFATDLLDLAYLWVPSARDGRVYVNVATLVGCPQLGETPYLLRIENAADPEQPRFTPIQRMPSLGRR